jgi:hypothetical protein
VLYPTFIAMDPFTFKTTTLLQDVAGDFVNTGSFGAIDTAKGVYYTLMQPKGTAGIHLARFDIANRQKTIIPLNTTIVNGHFMDGSIMGCDEDESGVYFAMINPATGKPTYKTSFGKDYSFGGGFSLTVDAANHIAYFALSPSHGGNVFHLFALSTKTGAAVRPPLVMTPTPDTQGPAGLTYIGENKIMALMPPVDGSWQIVVIDALTGKVTPTTALKDVPAMHGRGSGATWLLKQPLPGARKSGLVLSVGLFQEMGTSERMLGVDVECALRSVSMTLSRTSPLEAHVNTNCTISNRPWAVGPGGMPAVDLGLYDPQQ